MSSCNLYQTMGYPEWGIM